MARKIHLDRLTKRQRVRKGRQTESNAGRKAAAKAAKIIHWS